MAGTELQNAVDAIVRGEHADPFSVLGAHPAGPGGELVVRVFQPQASSVSVIDPRGRTLASLKRIHPGGVFAGPLPGRKRRFAYQLRVTTGVGEQEIEDPFRFSSVLGELDVHLLREGTHLYSYQKLGAHPTTHEGVAGVAFAVWAPNAQRVSVVGPFNAWDGRLHPMRLRIECGVWELFVPGIGVGERYSFEIRTPSGSVFLKADPYAFQMEPAPGTASIVAVPGWDQWGDQAWMETREGKNRCASPMSIYEVHLGSWRRVPEEGDRFLTYLELAERLIPYVKSMGFTHIELLPVSEHPFYGSWGYQPVGLYAPTSRYGRPADFCAFVDRCHQAEIGVILDWVPGHFPTDPHGLASFDGTQLYEHADPRQGLHREWHTLIYNYGRTEVRNFLLGNALFWLDKYHVDGLRVDAVASMLYLDYARHPGDWVPNQYGGRENLEAIDFLRRMNELVFARHPGATTIAEESTAWPMVSRPVYLGGLGFGFKWNMGWMHDTLDYLKEDPVYRRYHHDRLTFGLMYAFSENFVLPLSHDEVVYGKGSLIGRMFGDRWQKFANLRAYFGFMWTQPGKKLLFMGGEFAQEREWNHDSSLDWHLLDDPYHRGVQLLVADLNRLYQALPALHELESEQEGYEWIDPNDRDQSVLSYLRKARSTGTFLVVVCNFTPVPRHEYRVGVPSAGYYAERLNTDAREYGGSGLGNQGGVEAEPLPAHGRSFSLRLTLPPLSTLILVGTPVSADTC